MLLVLLCALCILFILTLVKYEDNDIVSEVTLLETAMTLMSGLVIFFRAFLKIPNELIQLLHKFSEIDMILNIRHELYDRNARLMKKKIAIFVLLYICLFIIDLLDLVKGIKSLIFVLSVNYIILIHFVTVMQFSALATCTKLRLQALNECIKFINPCIEHHSENARLCEKLGFINCGNNIHASKISWPAERKIIKKSHTKVVMTQQQKINVGILRIIYESLCDISSTINSMFGVQLLFITAAVFIEVTINLNIPALLIMSNEESMNMMEYLNVFGWVALQFSIMFFMTGSCNRIKAEADHSSVLLQRLLLIPELTPDITAEVQLFLQQVTNRKITFTACGFFEIDYGMLGSFVGAITTLLLIFVQFHMKSIP